MAKDTKERILAAALEMFAQNGYTGTNIRELTASLGLVKSSMYKHFKSKEDIWNRLLDEMVAYYARRFGSPERLPPVPDTLEGLVAMTMRMVDFTVHDEKIVMTRKVLAIEQFRDERARALASSHFLTGLTDMFTPVFAGMMEKGLIRHDDPAMLAFAYTAPISSLIHLCDREPEKTEEAITQIEAFSRHFVQVYGAADKGWNGTETERLTIGPGRATDKAAGRLEPPSNHADHDKGGNTMHTNDYIIRPEQNEDHRAVEDLVRESFWNVYRPGCSEHFVIHVLRDDPAFVKELDFVMEQDGKLIGQNMFMRTVIDADDGRVIPVLTMGPIGIAPELKRRGYGKKLLDYCLEKATALGFGAVLFEGNIGFYSHCGFSYARNFGIRYHDLPEGADDSFFLCRELIPGYLDGITGVYRTPQGYYVDDADVEAFDKEFPPKEKLRLPGQIF